MKTAKAGLTYFAIIFGVEFVLGAIRVLLVVPRLGVRTAELIEEPIMFIVVFLTARWLVKHFSLKSPRERLGSGVFGLSLLLAAEYVLLRACGLTLREDIARRDAVAGTVYLLMLLVFAVMPAFTGQHSPER